MRVDRSPLTVIALAWKEADHLAKCFESVKALVQEIGAETLIVLDSAADEITREVAHLVVERVVEVPFVSFSAQRNRAMELARTEWVFFIDADERCTGRLN